MTETEKELQRLAASLGGGWRMEHGVMPTIVLTLDEAKAAEERVRTDERRQIVASLRAHYDGYARADYDDPAYVSAADFVEAGKHTEKT